MLSLRMTGCRTAACAHRFRPGSLRRRNRRASRDHRSQQQALHPSLRSFAQHRFLPWGRTFPASVCLAAVSASVGPGSRPSGLKQRPLAGVRSMPTGARSRRSWSRVALRPSWRAFFGRMDAQRDRAASRGCSSAGGRGARLDRRRGRGAQPGGARGRGQARRDPFAAAQRHRLVQLRRQQGRRAMGRGAEAPGHGAHRGLAAGPHRRRRVRRARRMGGATLLRPPRSAPDLCGRGQGPAAQRRDRRAAGGGRREGPPHRIPGHRRPGRHGGAQAARHAEGRRRPVPLPRPRLLPRDSRGHREQGARHRAHHRDRPGRLRAGGRGLVPVLHRVGREGTAAQLPADDRARRAERGGGRRALPLPHRHGGARDRAGSSAGAERCGRAAGGARGAGGTARFRRHLRPPVSQRRVGDDERPHRGGGRPERRRQDHPLRGRCERRGVEIGRRGHHLPACLRQGAGAVDRRDRDRPHQSADGLGRHGRVVDAQLGLDRRRHLQIDGRRRDVDQDGPASIGADRPHRGAPAERQRGVRVRSREAVERQPRPRSLQDGGRGAYLGPGPHRAQRLDGMLGPLDGSEGPQRAVRRVVGLPPQGMDLPLRRRGSGRAQQQRPVSIGRRRRDLDRAGVGRTSAQALGTGRGGSGAVELERGLRVRRVEGLRAVPVSGRRQDLGGARQEPDDGLAPVLLRAPGGRPDQR